MTRKCENCGREAAVDRQRDLPVGWVRSGTSRYGTQYDKHGIAVRCPTCYADRNKPVHGDDLSRLLALIQGLRGALIEAAPELAGLVGDDPAMIVSQASMFLAGLAARERLGRK